MLVIRTKNELRDLLKSKRATNNLSVGFVPTMGALHEGHISLVKAARQLADFVVASVFVNPTQFNDASDLAKYPSTPDQDIRMLQDAGCDLLFMPDSNELYGSEQGNTSGGLKMSFPPLDQLWEGAAREGHFSGVGQVVSKLFNLVRPDVACFGKKDYQQLAIIRRLVAALDFDIKIVGVETMRELDGLAMSSRNVRLTQQGRATAPVLYMALQTLAVSFRNTTDIDTAVAHAKHKILDSGFTAIDYLSVVDRTSLEPVKQWSDNQSSVILVAAWLDGVRLIDNLEV